MLIDLARVARLERAKQHEERRVRLGYPDARAKLKALRASLDRAHRGEFSPIKQSVISTVDEITEAELRRACRDMEDRSGRDPYRRRSA